MSVHMQVILDKKETTTTDIYTDRERERERDLIAQG